mgnify:CR=1 FL=1
MIVHSKRNLDLDLMLTHLETMKMTGGKMSDSLFDDVYDLVKECKKQENRNKRKGEYVLNNDDYIIKNISDIVINAKVQKLGEEDVQDIKIRINDVRNPTIERVISEWDEDSNKIIISMKNTNMEMYYD